MMRILIVSILAVASLSITPVKDVEIVQSFNIDSLGACQGIARIDDKLYAYGDAATGVVREFTWENGALTYQQKQWKLTVNNQDIINHPTGFAHRDGLPFFIGNSVRVSPESTQWKAVIYRVNWEGMKRSVSLDGNLLNTIEDDIAIQGTRPEYVRYKGNWFVATADYGGERNEVRLYDPLKLGDAKKTSDVGVLVHKFSCGPWVQNLCWHEKSGMLVLVQNQIEGRRWRLSFLDLEKSIAEGAAVISFTKDFDNPDELEGLSFTQFHEQAIAVTSSRKLNGHLLKIGW